MSDPAAETEFEDERATLQGYFNTQWGTTSAVKWPNQKFDEGAQVAPWIAYTMLSGDGTQVSLGDRALHRHGGLIIIQVFQKELTGTKEQRLLAGKVARIWRRKEFTLPGGAVITFRTPFPKEVGRTNGWEQLNVYCPYIRSVFHERS